MEGTAAVSFVPPGLAVNLSPTPTNELVGYFLSSLRDFR